MNCYTFYEEMGGTYPRELLERWSSSFKSHGFTPCILGRQDAQRHPRYAEIMRAIKDYPTSNDHRFTEANWIRWLAFELVAPCLIAEFDVINYGLFPEQVPIGDFSLLGAMVVYATPAGISSFIDTFKCAEKYIQRDGDIKYVSDMVMLYAAFNPIDHHLCVCTGNPLEIKSPLVHFTNGATREDWRFSERWKAVDDLTRRRFWGGSLVRGKSVASVNVSVPEAPAIPVSTPEELTEIAAWPEDVASGATSVCNLKCVFCGHALCDTGHTATLPPEVVSKIASKAKRYVMHGAGEIFMHPRWHDFVPLKADVKAMFSTNGLLLTGRNLDLVFEKNISEINFSIDAGTAETYAKIRGGSWQRLWDNIDAVIEKRGSKLKPHLAITMCIMRANMETTPDLMRLAAPRRISVTFHHLHPIYNWVVPWNGGYPGNFVYAEQGITEADLPVHNAKLMEALEIARLHGSYVAFTGLFFGKQYNYEPLCELKT